mmetsp:Transcript_52679/g.44172  ORF Transcript_52679/g.44172 Transcript_52679/m.44172 type:complete len:105 (+) Transcript_52679:2-316(+)
MRKHCPADVAGDFRVVATPGFVEQARDSSVLFVDPHNEAIDTDSKFWTSNKWTIEEPLDISNHKSTSNPGTPNTHHPTPHVAPSQYVKLVPQEHPQTGLTQECS